MLKSVEETTLLTKLEELVQLAKKKKNVLEYQEINDFFKDQPPATVISQLSKKRLVS